jgi:hypothetical protein
MSIDLPYLVRLYWDNGRGFARMNKVQRVLTIAPVIEGLPPFIMLDFIPAVVAMVQEPTDKVRDLWPLERASVQRWLDSFGALW